MLAQFILRGLSELSPRLAIKAAWLYGVKGMLAVRAYKKRLARGEQYPPFIFVALTDACNLRCHGCWITRQNGGRQLSREDLEGIISAGKKQQAHFFTLLGGEPFLHPDICRVFEGHPECYFQIITNGMFFNAENVGRLRAAGNVTPLISLDGLQERNDERRGEGVFASVMEGMSKLQSAGLFFGVATTITGANADEVLSDEYVKQLIAKGAMYLWYYIYRPMSATPHLEYCLSKEKLLAVRRRLLELRRKHPILIIDSYWTASGEAFCPAALGLGYHVNPSGGIEICPALSFAKETIRDNDGELFKTINESKFLRGFSAFVKERTRGCVILEQPQQLHEYIRASGAKDYSGRDAFAELNALKPRHSHDLPGEEIPEDYWVYRFLKSQVFFGMSAMG
ncbi:MAG TPA: radical SAM protein [Planctomycetota bacterium]|jgi:MoaA/NifB/PqqE/SkfB family radical SAM enzyme